MTDDRPEPTTQPDPPVSVEPATSAEPADPGRRRFFRQFAGEVLTSAAQVVGVVGELRDRSAAEASALLAETRPAVAASTGVATPAASEPARDGPPTGFRTPFRFESDNVLLVIDQRKLPDALVEMPVRSASDAANAIRLMVVRGAPAIGQVAAIGLALTARIAAKSQAHTRRAILEGAADILRIARPTAINLRWAVDRLMARYHEIGALSEDGEAIAVALARRQWPSSPRRPTTTGDWPRRAGRSCRRRASGRSRS